MERPKRILIIDAGGIVPDGIEILLGRHGIAFSMADDISAVDAEIRENNPQALIVNAALSSDPAAFLDKVAAADSDLPVVVMSESEEDGRGIEFLKLGVYAYLRKPRSAEELYFIANNAINLYMEKRKVQALAQELEKRSEYFRTNLLELEFIKSLHHVIGETEDPVSVFKTAYVMIRNSLAFEIFAAVVPIDDEIQIYIYPNGRLSKSVAEYVLGTLIMKMASTTTSNGDKHVKVMLNGQVDEGDGQPENYQPLIVPLATREQTHGFVGFYRKDPFTEYEDSVGRRFCSHISFTLEKVGLFKEVKTLSIFDGLTGIYNHRSIVSKVDEERTRSMRYGSSLSVMLFDIDTFKNVNEAHGHLAGDAILKKVAQIFKTSLRSIDSVGRYGGEEFLIALPETEGEGAAIIGERLRKKVEDEAFTYNDQTIKITMSGGVAVYRQGMDTNKLIKAADDTLLRAKQEGKNILCYDKTW